jgi:hypothetical protein
MAAAEEAKQANIATMGRSLGEVYSALWQGLAIIFVYWKDYVELFGTKPTRIDILNQAAPQFFRMLQDELWGMSLLHIARLTDPVIRARIAASTPEAMCIQARTVTCPSVRIEYPSDSP